MEAKTTYIVKGQKVGPDGKPADGSKQAASVPSFDMSKVQGWTIDQIKMAVEAGIVTGEQVLAAEQAADKPRVGVLDAYAPQEAEA